MNIVVVSQLFYPDNFRINEIVSELVKCGHSVKVITGLPDYTTSKVPAEYKMWRRRREMYNGAEVIRVPTAARRKGVFFRALNYGSFVLTGGIYSLLTSKKNIDCIFVFQVSPVLQGIPAVWLKKRSKARLVLYCLDLWPESLKAWRVEESSVIFRLIKRVSKYIYNSCDTVAVTSKSFREYLTAVCRVDNNRIVYLPQHAEDLYKDIKCQYADDDKVDFMFAGNVGAVQNVDCIIRAVPYIKTRKHYHIHIVGNGSELERCRSIADDLKIRDKITFHGRHSLEEMKEFYKMADCLLLTLKGGSYLGTTLPAKLQGYLSCGKPIVGAIDGSGQEVIREADCGLWGPAGDHITLADNMTDMIENFEKYKQKGINGREYYHKHFRKEIFMDKLNDIIK